MDRKQFIQRWPNFTPEEFACKCGKCGADSGLKMHQELMDKLQALRSEMGFPFVITSGFRCAAHPAEHVKTTPGTHNLGCAVDIAVQGEQALKIVSAAADYGFTGIGLDQKGSGRFVHLDDAPDIKGRPRPWLWSY